MVLEKHKKNYQYLEDMYNQMDFNISSDKVIFYFGVHEFGRLTYDIITQDFPEECKEEVEDLFKDLIYCAICIASDDQTTKFE